MTDHQGAHGDASEEALAASGDDAVNTEAVNDGEEVASASAGATPTGSADAEAPGASGDWDAAAEALVADQPIAAMTEGPTTSETWEHPDTALAAQRLEDLQRLNAEYVNYKRRVDRDRSVVQERAVHDVLEALLPVLDDIHAARQHGDLADGPFASIADKLEATLGKYRLERFGAEGEAFDPAHHEALMHVAWPSERAEDEPFAGASATTVVTVLQPGYRAGEQVLRPARVAVADPE